MRGSLPRRALSALLLITLVASAAWAGQSSAWCPAMQKVHARCCCPHAAADAGPALRRAPCCEANVVPSLPVSHVAETALAAPSPTAVAMTWPPPPAPPSSAVPETYARAGRHARAGPDASLYRLNCALLI